MPKSVRFFALVGLTFLVYAVMAVVWPGQPVAAAAQTEFISTGDGTWEWQNPTPQGNILQGISCPNSTTCLAVGSAGTILKSTNGGVSWSPRFASTAETLWGVSCVGSTHCYAVGGQGTILRSTNGGDSWNKIASNTLVTLLAVDCVWPNWCRAVGDGGTILTTTNGTSWVARPSGTSNALRGIDCIRTGSGDTLKDTCVAVGAGGTVVTSLNGGKGWTVRSSGTTSTLYDAYCVDHNSCKAVGSGGTVLNSGNRGASWTSQNSGTAETLFGIFCPTGSACFAVGNLGTVRSTSNNGSTWAGESSGTANSLRNTLRDVSCTGATTCRLVGDFGDIWSSVFATRNDPESGTPVTRLFWDRRSAGSTNGLHGMSCPDVTTCFAAGNAGEIRRTTNSGLTWTTVFQDILRTLQDISCPTTGTCFAVGNRGAIRATTDGGANWVSQAGIISNRFFPLYFRGNFVAVSCPTTTDCYAVDKLGSIWSTFDGSTWVDVSPAEKVTLNDIDCPGRLTCYAVGAPGTILKTTTGGPWETQPSGTSFILRGVQCADTTHCVAVGDGGTIVATTNGSTWSPQNAGTASSLFTVSCPTQSACYAAGELGTILTTSNGGTLWSRISSGSSSSIERLSCPTQYDCFAAGPGGSVLAKRRVNLEMVKSVATATLAPGDRITYTLQYKNTGARTATGVVITDILPITITSPAFTSSGPQVTRNQNFTFTWTVADLVPLGSGSIQITGIISGNLRSNVTLVNTATIASTEPDVFPANNSSTVNANVIVPPPQTDLTADEAPITREESSEDPRIPHDPATSGSGGPENSGGSG